LGKKEEKEEKKRGHLKFIESDADKHEGRTLACTQRGM
jgi:hypothetical protein